MLITLSDDSEDEQQPMITTAQQQQAPTGHRPLQQQQTLRTSGFYGGCQLPVPTASNVSFVPNARLPLQNQLHHYQQQNQTHMKQQNFLTQSLMKVRSASASNTKMDVLQQQKQRLAPQPTAGGVTMAIMNERPLDIKALLNHHHPNHDPTLHAFPTHPLGIKEQLIAYFQQQHKVQMVQRPKTTTSVNGSKENGGTFPPRDQYKNIAHNAAWNRQPTIEWRPQFNIPLMTTKPRMVMTRNNNFANGKKIHHETSLIFCNTYVEAQNKRTLAGFGIVEEEFTGQFLCTFQNCNKRLKNNVLFMHHIWAHVAHQKPIDADEQCTDHRQQQQLQQQPQQQTAEQQQNAKANANGGAKNDHDDDGCEGQRSDVSRLHMCPECLLEQPTPFRAHLHYHRVHKRGKRPMLDNRHGLHVCNICEQVIDAKSIGGHCAAHSLPDNSAQLALPYGCRFSIGTKCQFRTSNRGALLRHFCHRHVGTHVVLCPFCLLTFSVPPADKRCSFVRMREFVRHMALHDGEKSLCCRLCVVKFPHSQRSLMGAHEEQQHSAGGEPKWLQWQMQRMDLNDLVPDKSLALVSSDMGIPQCVECGQMVHNLERHLGKERRGCPFCAFVSRCSFAMGRHRLLAQCNTTNATRTPFFGWASPLSLAQRKTDVSVPSSSSSLVKLGCGRCNTFRSVNVKTLAEHFVKVHQIASIGSSLVPLLLNNGRPLNNAKANDNNTISSSSSNNNGGQQKQQQQKHHRQSLSLIVEQHLEQYSRDVIREEQHEAELFGLRRAGDDASLEAPLEPATAEEEDGDAGATKGEREAMRDWLCTFMPLLHAHKLSIQPHSPLTQFLEATRTQEDASGGDNECGDDDGFAAQRESLWAKQRAEMEEEEKEMSDFRIRMGFVLDNFTFKNEQEGSIKRRVVSDGPLKAEPKGQLIQKSH